MSDIDFNQLAEEIHANNVDVGWWDGEQCIFTKLQLISTEIAEATEGERKDLMDDKLPHRKMGEVELADALIRTLDLGGYLGLKYSAKDYVRNDIINWVKDSENSIGKQHLGLNAYVTSFGIAYEENDKAWLTQVYSNLLDAINLVSKNQGYSLFDAMVEKLEFNQTRPDHKRSNRAKAHGKQF